MCALMSPWWLALGLLADVGREAAVQAVVQDAQLMWADNALPARAPVSVADWRAGWPPWMW